MHPDGHGQHILPQNFVIKTNPKTGAEKKVLLEHALGYFWALKVGVWSVIILLLRCSLDVPHLVFLRSYR